MKNKISLLIVLSTLLLVSEVGAEEIAKKPVIVDGDKVEFLNKEKRVIGTGNVVIVYEDMKLTCDNVIVYMDSHDAYAEGHVTLYQEDNIFRSDKMGINFDTKKGTILASRFETPVWYGGGPMTEKVADKEYHLMDGYITSCDFIEPHYRIQGKKVYLYLDDKVVLKNAFMYVGDMPVLYLPSYTHSFDDNKPRVTIIPGRSKDWGEFVLTSWRYYLSENNQGRIQMDERTKRDFASGIEHRYKTEDFGSGNLRMYYMNERRLEDDIHRLPRVLEEERERFTADLRHRWQVDKETLALVEYHAVKYQDTTFLKDYFYRDRYENEPSGESYISIAKTLPEYSLNFLAQKRVNRHESVTEVLPELKVDFAEREIGDTNLYYFSNLTAASYNLKPAAPSDDDTDANVFDTNNKLSYNTRFPWLLKFINFTPYVATQQTYYSKDIYGEERDFFRGIYSGGFSMTTKFYKVLDFYTNLWNLDINRLRHVITPTVSYGYVHAPTVSSDQVGFLGVNGSNGYTFDLENKLQTKWHEGEGADSLTAMDIARLNTNITFTPNTKGNRWSNISSTLEIRPYKWLAVSADTAYSNYTRDFNGFNLDLKASSNLSGEELGEDKTDEWKRWEFGIGHRYTRNSSTEMTVDTSFPIGWKWRFQVFNRIYFKKFKEGGRAKAINEMNEQEYTITRDLHCWNMDISYSNTRGYGEAIWLIFRLKAFPDIPIEYRNSYHERKFGSQSYN
ncbi:MAG: hypothetical protein AUJ75_03170 [Candidatus Omnitrophica bacterium CG1_02_49_10]|nr:MAG: hypothetical protein AUJ75_03170 [Candidatus Omnitrophica bacterium CG1_02_49_10]